MAAQLTRNDIFTSSGNIPVGTEPPQFGRSKNAIKLDPNRHYKAFVRAWWGKEIDINDDSQNEDSQFSDWFQPWPGTSGSAKAPESTALMIAGPIVAIVVIVGIIVLIIFLVTRRRRKSSENGHGPIKMQQHPMHDPMEATKLLMPGPEGPQTVLPLMDMTSYGEGPPPDYESR